MAKSPSRYKKHDSRSNLDTFGLLFVVILLYGLWSNKVFLKNAERILVIAVIVAVLTIVAVILARYIKLPMILRLRKSAPSLETIDTMTGIEFEHCVAKLLAAQGYTNISLTERYDYGVDIIARKDDIRWGIQVKRHRGMVKADAVRQVVTGLRKYNCNKSMVVTNSSYSRVAKELAKNNDCVLVDRNILKAWIVIGRRV
jgi:restriction system protein